MDKERSTNLALGFMVGVTTGLAMGILYAPRKGEETRRIIAEKTKQTVGNAKDKTKAVVGQTRETIGHMADKTQAAVKEGARAAREA